MTVAGFFLKAHEARIVTLEGTRERHAVIASKFNKLALPKNPAREDVSAFVRECAAFCSANGVEKIVLNRRATSGQGAGGSGTFLIEGILLASSPVPVEFVHPATIRASDKRRRELKQLKPGTVDLGKAYDLSFEGLP